jgi:ADP-ribosylglycohydrolase
MKAAILGQFVGDALCLGSHWYYNFVERRRRYPDGIQGFERPHDDHYHAGREPGDPTHYGDAALVLLQSVAERGRLDPVDYGRRFVERFGDPGYKGYLDKPTRITLENWRGWTAAHPDGTPEQYGFQDGAADEQNVTTSRLAPVVVRHVDDPGLEAAVEACTRVCQNHDNAVLHTLVHARILKSLFDGAPLGPTLDAVIGSLDGPYGGPLGERYADAKAMRGEGVHEVTGEFGRACYLSSSFPATLHAALRHGDSFETALMECCRAGGDSASRCAVLGAWLGAAHGLDGIPADWLSRLRARAEVERLTDRLLAVPA